MRRSTQNCSFVAAEQARLRRELAAFDPVAVATVLEEFATPERVERLRSVVAARVASVTVVMDAPHDPHNGAAVIRSCDAFGVQHLHIVERREPFLASNTVARGSERWVDVESHATAAGAIGALAASGHELIATHPEGELTPEDLAKVPRFALVLGNERDGIHDELSSACKRSVRIPMRGFAESLNVSVTAAILIQHATAGRPGDLPVAAARRIYARMLVLSVAHSMEILAVRGIVPTAAV